MTSYTKNSFIFISNSLVLFKKKIARVFPLSSSSKMPPPKRTTQTISTYSEDAQHYWDKAFLALFRGGYNLFIFIYNNHYYTQCQTLLLEMDNLYAQLIYQWNTHVLLDNRYHIYKLSQYYYLLQYLPHVSSY